MTARHPVRRTSIQSFRARTLVSGAPPAVAPKRAGNSAAATRERQAVAVEAIETPRSEPPQPISKRATVAGEAHVPRSKLLPSERKTAVGGGADSEDRLPRSGDILGGCYRLVRKLGEGMFGQVYEAERTDVPEHRVALKVMRRTVYAGRNVDRELVMLAAAAHPNIVQLKDHGTTADLVWLTMPLYEGETLEDRLERGTLTVREAHAIFVPIARGLEALHQRGLRHQDVKPDNVFLARFGGQLHPMLLDLGVAVEKCSSFVAGTALFGAPEQIAALGGLGSAAPLSEKVDCYCLATTLLRSLVGPDYFPGEEATSPLKVADSFDERETQPLRAGALPELSDRPRQRLNDALASWLRKDPALRPSAADIAEQLDVLLEQERDAAHAIEQSMARQKTSLGRVRLALAATALLLAAGGLYGYSKRETLRLAGELSRARAQGAASFDKLDTCAAAHRLSQQQKSSCEQARTDEQRSHRDAVAGIVRDKEQVLAGITQRLDRQRARLRSCREDAETERTQHEQAQQRWQTASDAQLASFEAERLDWKRSSSRKDEALTSCESGKQQSVSAELQCQQQLASVSKTGEQCTSRLAEASAAQQSCQQQLMSCQSPPAPPAAPADPPAPTPPPVDAPAPAKAPAASLPADKPDNDEPAPPKAAAQPAPVEPTHG